MANLKKTWFLVPTWEIPPSAIRLGYLIATPTDPRYPLNPTPPTTASTASPGSSAASAIDTEIFSDITPELSMEISGDSSTMLGLFAQFLQFIGLTAEAKLSVAEGTINTYVFEKTETKWFSPSLEFAVKAVKEKKVQDFLEMARLRQPLYMITGVKTVTGASLSTSRTKGHSYSGKVGVDASADGVPLSTGLEFERSKNEGTTMECKKDGPIVFAYQLTQVKLRNARVKVEPFTRGAAFEIEEGQERAFEVELSDDLLDLRQKNKKAMAKKTEVLPGIDERTGEECVVVIPGSRP